MIAEERTLTDGGAPALVVGAATGIGLATATLLADRGFQVTGTWHQSPHPDDNRIRWVQLDVGSNRQRSQLWSTFHADSDTPDILVYSPAILRDQSILRLDAETFRDVFEHNLSAAVDCVRALAPAMTRRRWGRIVLIGSAVSQLGNPGQSAYVASKSAMVGWARTIARELGPRQITVNVVEPGIIDTSLVRDAGERLVTNMVGRTPLRRAGRAEEIAEVVAYLVSDRGAAVTGAQLRVDGGLSVALAP